MNFDKVSNVKFSVKETQEQPIILEGVCKYDGKTMEMDMSSLEAGEYEVVINGEFKMKIVIVDKPETYLSLVKR